MRTRFTGNSHALARVVRDREVGIRLEGLDVGIEKILLVVSLVRFTRYEFWEHLWPNEKKPAPDRAQADESSVLLRDLTDTQGLVLERDDIRRLSVPYI